MWRANDARSWQYNGTKAPRRKASRNPLLVIGSAVAVEGSRSVLLENLSATGAGLRGRGLPAAGDKILLWLGELQLFGSVAWMTHDRAGVAFDNSLGSDERGCLESMALTI